jgi:phage-related protein
MVDGKQFTVAWHVDDLKILHVSAKVVDDLIANLDSKFGKESPLSKSWGKVHNYLGMTLDFSVPGQVTVTMIDYIKMICMDLPNGMIGTAATPAANHLF